MTSQPHTTDPKLFRITDARSMVVAPKAIIFEWLEQRNFVEVQLKWRPSPGIKQYRALTNDFCMYIQVYLEGSASYFSFIERKRVIINLDKYVIVENILHNAYFFRREFSEFPRLWDFKGDN